MPQAPTRATAAWRGSNGERLGAAGISLGRGEFARELAPAGIGPRLESIERFTDGRRRKIAAVGRTSSAKWPLRTRYDCYDFMVGGHRPGHVRPLLRYRPLVARLHDRSPARPKPFDDLSGAAPERVDENVSVGLQGVDGAVVCGASSTPPQDREADHERASPRLRR